MDKNSIFGLLLFVAIIAVIIYIKRKFKMPKVGAMALITGGVKAGKTTFAVALAYKNYKRVHRRWVIKTFFRKLFRLKPTEEPLLYSNIPLAVPFVPVTTDLLQRKKRFRYGSVIYLSEASLVADNSIYKDMDVNERIMLFNKLIGHETCGGLLVYDTQAIGDMPAVTRRCLGQYFYVHHTTKWIPFFLVAFVRECRYSEDGSTVSVESDDTEGTLKRVIIPKSVWKKFDCYCYSYSTDDLPVVSNVVTLPKKSDLRCKDVVSFRKYNSLHHEDK